MHRFLSAKHGGDEEKTIRKNTALRKLTERFDDLSPDETIGAFGGSGQWVELMTVGELRTLAAAIPALGRSDEEGVKAVERMVAVREAFHGKTEIQTMPASFLARHRTICAVLEEIRDRARYQYDPKIVELVDEAKLYAERMSAGLMKGKELREVVRALNWKSTDKDNMEFRADTTCYVLDKLRDLTEKT